MRYEYIRDGLDEHGKQKYATKIGNVLVAVSEYGKKSYERREYQVWRAINPERRAKRLVCAELGITSGRQTRKLRKRIRREGRAEIHA